MAVSVFLSPYLRSFLLDGQLVYDNAVTERREVVEPLLHEVVRSLWGRKDALGALAELSAAHGVGAIARAVDELVQRRMVFADREQCDRALDMVLGSRVPAVPFIDQVELTSHCPFRCQFCPRGVPGRMARPSGFMDIPLFERLVREAHPDQARYRPLELHHLGESLLHPEIERFVEIASARGLPTEISVNPSLLDPVLAGRLIRAGLRRIVLSLDGMDAHTLAVIRGPVARFEAAERNIDALLGLVAKAEDPPIVVIQMLDLHANRHQRAAFLERWGRTGLGTVQAVIKDLDGPDPDDGRPTSTPVVHLCNYPFRSVVVLWDGRVVPCCRDSDAALVLGNLREMSLREIWCGPAAVELRRRHLQTALEEGHLCHGCAWSRERFAAAMPSRHPDAARPNPYLW